MPKLHLPWEAVKRFHDAAWKHQEAGEFLLAGCSNSSSSTRAAEAIYLGGYAVECILKALFLSQFRPKRHPKVIREFITALKHDLEKLKNRLERLKKPVMWPEDQVRNLRKVRRMWSSEMRYQSTTVRAEDARLFFKCMNGILLWICG
jgi:hypothetical protein